MNPFFFPFLLLGKNYLTWQGIRPQLVITEVELVKEVLRNSEGAFRKKKAEDFIHKIIGDGLVATEGEKWARQRKLANHAFHGESLKVKLSNTVYFAAKYCCH